MSVYNPENTYLLVGHENVVLVSFIPGHIYRWGIRKSEWHLLCSSNLRYLSAAHFYFPHKKLKVQEKVCSLY